MTRAPGEKTLPIWTEGRKEMMKVAKLMAFAPSSSLNGRWRSEKPAAEKERRKG